MQRADSFIALMAHGLGGTPPSELSLWGALNRAGRALTNEHGWSWRIRKTTLVGVSGAEHIALPTDFGRLLSIHAANLDVCIKTIEELEEMRAQTTSGSSGTVYVCPLGWSTPFVGDEPTQNRLELFPTPTEDGAPSFRLAYLKRWFELSSSDPGGQPKIPDDFEAALIYRARAEAWHLQNQEPCIEDAMYKEEVNRLRAAETGIVVNHGRITGGAGDYREPDGWMNVSGVSFS